MRAHLADRPVRVVTLPGRALADPAGWALLTEGSAAVLVVPDDDVAGATGWRQPVHPFVTSSDGRLVPIGWLDPSMLPGAVPAAVEAIGRRGSRPGPVVMLGGNRARTAATFDWLEAEWPHSSKVRPPRRWTSDRVGWEDCGLVWGPAWATPQSKQSIRRMTPRCRIVLARFLSAMAPWCHGWKQRQKIRLPRLAMFSRSAASTTAWERGSRHHADRRRPSGRSPSMAPARREMQARRNSWSVRGKPADRDRPARGRTTARTAA